MSNVPLKTAQLVTNEAQVFPGDQSNTLVRNREDLAACSASSSPLAITDLGEFYTLFRHESPKAALMLWKHMSLETASDFLHSSTDQHCHQLILHCCSCSFPQLVSTDLLQLLVELLVHILSACRQRGYSAAQISCVYGIIVTVHRTATSSCGSRIDTVSRHFEELLRMHCVHRPPVSLDLFSLIEAQWLTSFFFRVYVRHFALIMRAFTDDVTVNIELSYQQYTPKSPAIAP